MNIEHYIRVGRLLAELHGDETLSEQQCAKIMGVDLVSWRIIEHTFSRGSWGETVDESGPTSEEAIRAALSNTSAPAVDGARDEREAFEAWMMTRELDGRPDLKRDAIDDRFYDCFDTQRVWRGWLARAALSVSTEAAAGEPIYQLKLATGDWRDQDESAYRYNAKHCPQDVRIVYTAPPAAISEREALTKADMIELYHIAREKPKSEWMYIVRAVLAKRRNSSATASDKEGA